MRNPARAPSASAMVDVAWKWSRNTRGSACRIGRPHQSSTTAMIGSKSSGVAVRSVMSGVTPPDRSRSGEERAERARADRVRSIGRLWGFLEGEATGAGVAIGEQARQRRDRDLRRGPGADVEADGTVHPGDLARSDAEGLERLDVRAGVVR